MKRLKFKKLSKRQWLADQEPQCFCPKCHAEIGQENVVRPPLWAPTQADASLHGTAPPHRCCSVSVVSTSLQPHGLQDASLSCAPVSPRACSNSCPLSQWSHPTFPSLVAPSPLALNLSQHRVFANKLALYIRWPKYWSFGISPSSEYSGLISFRIDWLDLLAAQGTLKSLLQLHSSKASIFCHSACFMVQLSHPYMTTGKIIALTIQIFVGKVMSLLFNTKCRFVIAFLPRSKHLLISWLQSPPTVILEPKKRKSVTASTFSPSICLEVMGLDAMILVFWMLSSKPAFSFLFHPQESL